MITTYKEKFYGQVFTDIIQTTKYQKKLFKEHGGKVFNVNGSLAEVLGFAGTNNGGKQSEICRDLKKELKLNEEVYF